MSPRTLWIAAAMFCLAAGGVLQAAAQPSRQAASGSTRLTLAQAVVCEEIRDGVPVNSAIAFPVSTSKIFCFTLFDAVAEDTFVFHQWYFRDRPSSRIRLSVKAPRWSTFSSIQLREADRGPWRVEVQDASGRVLKTLRFSITD